MQITNVRIAPGTQLKRIGSVLTGGAGRKLMHKMTESLSMKWIDLYNLYRDLQYRNWDHDEPMGYFTALTVILENTKYFHQKCKYTSTAMYVIAWNNGKDYPDSEIVHCPNCGDNIWIKEIKV